MKKFKVLSLMLVVTVLFGIMCVPAVSASSQEAAKLVFSSDEAWPATLTNTTEIYNNDEYWNFKFSNDSGKTYTSYKLSAQNNTYYFVAPKLNGDQTYDYSYVENTGNKTKVFKDADTTSSPSTQGSIIGKWWMKPAGAINRRVAKVFTAPYTGKITISAKDESGTAKIYCKKISDSATKGPVLSIAKKDGEGNDNILWSKTKDYTSTSESTEVQSISFDDIEVEVNKGDELWFIVSGEQSANGKTKFVYWNPVITYTKTITDTVIYTDYSSDEAWPATVTNTTEISNDDEYWKFKYSVDSGTTYTDYSEQKGNNTYYFVAPRVSNGTYDYTHVETSGNHTRVWVNGSTVSDPCTSGAVIGKWWMRPGGSATHRVAKVFTAPYTGKITISAKDESGLANIYSRVVNNGAKKGPVLYIEKKTSGDSSTQLWTKTADDFSGNVGTFVKTINFSDVEVEVNQGDELWFIVSGEQTDNLNAKYVYWNPTVHYDKIGVSAPEFSSADSTSLDTFSAVVSAGTLNVSLPVNSILTAEQDAVMCVAVYDEDGKLSDAAISETTVIPDGGSVTLKIENMTVKNITNGYVKVFLFDSMETLVPLDDIGAAEILSSSAQ